MRVQIVEPYLNRGNPSFKALAEAIPTLDGRDISFVGIAFDRAAEFSKIETRFVPSRGVPSFLLGMWFFLYVNTVGWWRFGRGRRRADVVLTTGGRCLWADVSIFHFFNPPWLGLQWKLGLRSGEDMRLFLQTIPGVAEDLLQLWMSGCLHICAVSLSIEDMLRSWGPDRKFRYSLLPNTCDRSKLNPEFRRQHRPAARQELGYAEEDAVFLFASQGHYRRKGFWLAIEALATVRASGHPQIKFLVVGGHARTLDRLKVALSETVEDWEEWVKFTGMVEEAPRYFSAADAFLFPSYFEAFSLVEIEANALGLPLLLTRHPGSEMSLVDGVNGQFVQFDPADIARVVEDWIEEGFPENSGNLGKALSASEYAGELERVLRRVYLGGSAFR